MEYLIKLIICIFILFCKRAQSQNVDGPDVVQYPVKPEKCYGTDEVMDAKCCIIPPFYVREIARTCGAIFAFIWTDQSRNVSGFRRESLNCDHFRCILSKYGLLTPNDHLDIEQFFAHLDKWVDINPAFSKVIKKAINYGKEKYKLYMPINVCEYFRFQDSIRYFIKLDCPIRSMIDSDVCRAQKEFYDQCRVYFL